MATTTNFGWETPDDTDLVKDGALAMRTLGNAIDASLVDLKGGTTGQVLSKTSNTDMDFTWVTSDDANAIQNAIVDAKGDLITATAADTPARLAVGSNGDTLVADSAATTGLRWSGTPSASNPVINSDYSIWQRGTSISVPSNSYGYYTSDRWHLTVGGTSQAHTVSRQVTGDTTNLPNIQYCARVQRNSGQSSTNGLAFVQSFETVNSIPYAGKTVTMSFYARKGADYSPASSVLSATIWQGTGTDQNAQVGGYTGQSTNGSNVTLTSTWQRFSFTASINAATTELSVGFSNVPSGTASTNDYFEVTGVQLDIGSVALPYRRSGGTLQGEIALAQRYYFRTTAASNANANFALGTAASTSAIRFPIKLPVTMRVTPSALDFSNMRVSDGATGYNLGTFALGDSSGGDFVSVTYTQSSPFTQFRPYLLQADGNTAAYLGFTAEL